MMKTNDGSLTDAQFRAELDRCIYCEEKPCQEACPAHCSPADFIMAAKVGEKSDLSPFRSPHHGRNPLGWVCGVVCPDYFCMKACSRRTFDRPIEIPAVQATSSRRPTKPGWQNFNARRRMEKPSPSSAPDRRAWARRACWRNTATRSRFTNSKSGRRDDESDSGFPAEQKGGSRRHRFLKSLGASNSNGVMGK
jgi:hypothetical protein